MKLRIRYGSVTHRMQMSDAVTYGELKLLIGSELRLLPDSIKLSLNNKVELGAEDREQLRANGVKGGDLLWMTGAAPDANATGASVCVPEVEEKACEAAHEGPPQAVAKAQEGARHSSSSSAQPAEPTEDMEASISCSRPAWNTSDILARVQEASPEQEPLVCSVHAAFLEAGLRPCWSDREAQDADRFRMPRKKGHLNRLSYSYATSIGVTRCCEVRLVRMGPFLTIHGVAKDGVVHTLSLDGKHFSSSRQPATGRPPVLAHEGEMWILLKDRVVRPVVADMRVALGLAAPPGLTNLPAELAEKLLHHLEAKDLLSLIGTCTAMRSQASTDVLWEPLTRREFEDSTGPEDEDDASMWNWMRVFRMKYAEREAARRQAEDLRRLERRRRPYPFPAAPFGRGPFASRTRIGQYRQIGGDYDRNPLLFQGANPAPRPFLGGQGWGGFRFT